MAECPGGECEVVRGFLEGKETENRGRGRPATVPPAEKIRNLGICGNQADIDYLALYRHEDPTGAFRDILEVARTWRPTGPGSGPGTGKNTHAGKLAPGSKTMLKRELAEARQEIERLRDELAAVKPT